MHDGFINDSHFYDKQRKTIFNMMTCDIFNMHKCVPYARLGYIVHCIVLYLIHSALFYETIFANDK